MAKDAAGYNAEKQKRYRQREKVKEEIIEVPDQAEIKEMRKKRVENLKSDDD